MIAITGANGQLGRTTIQFLLKNVEPQKIIAVVRDPSKVSDLQEKGILIRKAAYENPDALLTAIDGAEQLLQISTTSVGQKGIDEERNVVMAALKAGVKHIHYTSSIKPGRKSRFIAAIQSIETENSIRNSGMKYTLFRNSLYMEAIPQIIGNLSEIESIIYPAGNGKVNFVSRADIALAITRVMLSPKAHENAEYEITGERPYTFGELATMISAIKKSKTEFQNISLQEYEMQLLNYGIPATVVKLLVSMADGIGNNEFSFTDKSLETLLGRKPLNINEYITDMISC